MTSEKKPTRAETMAATYGAKLEELKPTPTAPRQVRMSDKQTPEQKERLRIAKERLREFKDLIR